MKMMKFLGIIPKKEDSIFPNLDIDPYKHLRYKKSIGGGRSHERLKQPQSALYSFDLFSTRIF
jgi:hypothetical protein